MTSASSPRASANGLGTVALPGLGLFTSLKIGARIGAGFGLIILLLAAVAAVAWNALGDARTGTATLADRSDVLVSITEFDLDVERLMSALNDYLATGGDEAFTEVQGQVGHVQDAIAEIDALIQISENKERLLKMAAVLPTITRNVTKLSELDSRRAELENGVLAPVGTRAGAAIAEVMDRLAAAADYRPALALSDLRQALMQTRLSASRFAAAHDESLVAPVTDSVANTLAIIEQVTPMLSAEDRGILAGVHADFETYRTGFGELVATIVEQKRVSADTTGIIANQLKVPADEVQQIAKETQLSIESETLAAADADRALALTVAGIAIALGMAFAFVIARGITRPVNGMTRAMGTLAGGDISVEIVGRGRKDEIGEMAEAVQVFKESMIRTRELEAEQVAAEKRAVAEKKRLMNELADSFQSSVGGIVETVSSSASEMQVTAQSLTSTAEETSRQSTAVAAASEQASTNVQTVASAAEELSSSITEISRQVGQSAQIAGKAVTDAERTNVQVQGLAEAAQKIGEVVNLITDIASQTNLLALNATIEAARAGDAGKGFAVVASEVKNLANETAKATEEITGQITSIQAATREAVSAIQSIGQTIGQINEIATTIASAVEEQGAATQEIARNVQQASAGTSEVSSNITGVTQAAGETGAAASQMLSASGELARQGEHLRGEVDKFLQAVRAA